MLKTAFLIFIFCRSLALLSQDSAGSTLRAHPVLKAENEFAAFVTRHGKKNAIIKFLDPGGRIFIDGQALHKSAYLEIAQDSSGSIYREPLYWSVSYSGELGFVCGSWTYCRAGTDTISAIGHYATIWKKASDSSWKIIADIDLAKIPGGYYGIRPATLSYNDFYNFTGTTKSLLKRERDFIRRTHRRQSGGWSRLYWYKKFNALSGILLRTNRMPAILSDDMVMGTINQMPARIRYKITANGISAAGDMGYILGTTVINGKEKNYIHVWKAEEGNWRLALEVLCY